MLKRHAMMRIVGVGVVALTGLATACGYAKKKDVQAEIASVRQQMESGDQALGNRIDQVSGRVDQLQTQLNDLQDKFNVTVQKMEGMIAFDVPVHFDYDKADLRSTDTPVLDKFAAVVREYYPNALVTVEGFTDPAGSRAYNMRLGNARADAVKDYLTSQGNLTGDLVRTVSYGESKDRLVQPGAKGPGEAGMVNRRVALVIDYSGSTPAPSATVTQRLERR